MKQHPYIGQQYSAIILFYAEDKGLVVDDVLGLDENIKIGEKIVINNGTDITHEYLSNTWGVVESKEHAEFIIELAELHGFACGEYDADIDACFYTSNDALDFTTSFDVASNGGESRITIPLPPKTKDCSPEVGDEVC
jgi:hypothetical protein